MKLHGDKVKSFRKASGLSQSELASGICTQATISLIENKNQLPGMTILTKICERLGITIGDVIEDDNSNLTDVFAKVDDAIVNQDAKMAADQLNSIRIKQLRTSRDKQRYYYSLGMLTLLEDGSTDEALFNFNLAINQFGTSDNDIYQVLALTAAGTSYMRHDDKDQAIRLAKQSIDALKNEVTGSNPKQLIFLRINLAKLCFSLEMFKESRHQIDLALVKCREIETIFAVDEIYFQIALIDISLGVVTEAKKALQIAKSISIVSQHHDLQQKIDQQIIDLP